ncbi:sulfite exporter TauE/SafE family protein [soil metagenome]
MAHAGAVDLSFAAILAVVAVGFASGVLSGMVGIGGATVTTPGIRFLGATPIEAVGSTIPAILPGAVAGSIRYSREGLVEWRVASVSGAVGAGFAVLGAWLSDIVNAHLLMVVTAGLLGSSAIKMLREVRATPAAALRSTASGPDPVPPAPDGTDEPSGTPRHRSFPLLAAVGAGSGALAGLLGVGGGLVLVPGFTHLLDLPVKRAVATSLVAVAIFSVPAMVTHAVLDHINWSYALLLMVGVVPGARAGARFTIRGSDARLKLIAGTLFAVVAVVYGGRELLELL